MELSLLSAKRQLEAALGSKLCHTLHTLHHLLAFFEVLQKLVDILYTHAAACSDTFTTAAVDDFRFLSFLLGHGADDCFNAVEFFLVHISFLQLLADAAHAGD